MQVQKKRNSSKKLKSINSESQLKIPLGTIMDEISSLKSQLASIKSKKSYKAQKNLQSGLKRKIQSEQEDSYYSSISKQDVQKPNFNPLSKQSRYRSQKNLFSIQSPKASHDNSKTMLKFGTSPHINQTQFNVAQLEELKFPIRQHQLKLNIEFNKLYRYIKSLPSQQHCQILTEQLNRNIVFLNRFLQEVAEHANNNVYEQLENQTLNLQEILMKEKEKVFVLQEANRELQREIIGLRHNLAQENVRNQESNELYEVNLELMQKQKQLIDELEHTRIAYEGLRDDREKLEEKLRVFEKAVEQKQQQILVLEEDIRYNRQESQKHRSQKKQLEKLYKQIHENYKILKNKYENEVEMVNKEKQKWKKECENRRMGQSQLLTHQEHKNALKKELQEMRRENLLKSNEYNDIRSKMHEEQRRNISLQGQNYQLITENEKLKRTVQFCKQQIKDMGQQVEEMRKYADKHREKNKEESKKMRKNQTLDEIRQLIQGHRKAVIEEDEQEQ